MSDLTTKLTVQLALTAARSFATAKSAKLNSPNSVNVLDGGNRFDGLKLTRELRRQTRDYHAALSRVTVARAFTCYQMETLLAKTPPGPTPTLVMELLTTFADENVALPERRRLLDQCLGHMEHLSRIAPLFVTAQPADDPLFDALYQAAQHHWTFEIPSPVTQLSLF